MTQPRNDGGEPPVERRNHPRARGLLRWYYDLKYRPFRCERREYDCRRGLVMPQIDALSHADLRRAIAIGKYPTIARLLAEDGFSLRRSFCGLPSATP